MAGVLDEDDLSCEDAQAYTEALLRAEAAQRRAPGEVQDGAKHLLDRNNIRGNQRTEESRCIVKAGLFDETKVLDERQKSNLRVSSTKFP